MHYPHKKRAEGRLENPLFWVRFPNYSIGKRAMLKFSPSGTPKHILGVSKIRGKSAQIRRPFNDELRGPLIASIILIRNAFRRRIAINSGIIEVCPKG